MPLLDLMELNQKTILELSIQQVVSTAGDGKLRDGSLCSQELRQYLNRVPTEKLRTYVESCLRDSFEHSGLVLQDLVNELGQRLEYDVEHGLYQGKRNEVGFDGIWRSADSHDLVIEVKTTDAYRISLNTLAKYRHDLIDQHRLSSTASMLIVVGREDTGDLESQIRGSKHAWDMRVISIDALIQLVLLKEGTEEKETLRKIQTLLTPIEYTRLDNLVDVLFTAAKDVETSTTTMEADLEAFPTLLTEQSESPQEPRKQLRTDASEMTLLRETVMSAFSQKQGVFFTAKSKAMFWTADKAIRVCCTLSKPYQRSGQLLYWYAFHPRWQQFLTEGQQGYCIFGCVGRTEAFALPVDFIQAHLDHCYTTEREDRLYWHIELIEESGEMHWLLRKSNQKLSLTPYRLTLS